MRKGRGKVTRPPAQFYVLYKCGFIYGQSHRIKDWRRTMTDLINHPPHYTRHPSGVECITITEWFNFNLGNVIKYLWRSDEKEDILTNLKKARWYLDREIARREGHPEQ